MINNKCEIALRFGISSIQQESLRVQRCRVLLMEFKGKASFQWIPSRCDETTDFLANKGTAILQMPCRHLPLHSAKLEIE
ncbi:hypothetical protein NPIL_384401 [Nephila pilipes]|uniref:Uncharacterized protein n=1 Tax=Nephila pilipes TaxID=299642 RepID=A0A8X6QXN8_NEPPI|nr:hypothetical protein NPIL_384401 [Nephila pilipes]